MNAATLDHFIPKSIIPIHVKRYLRSNNEYDPNLVLSCHKCNTDKANRIPENWDGKLGPFRYNRFNQWVWEGYPKYCGNCRETIYIGSYISTLYRDLYMCPTCGNEYDNC